VKITIPGAGCSRFSQAADAVRQAVERASDDAAIDKVEDAGEFMRYHRTVTPASAMDGRGRIFGRVPTVEEIQSSLSEDPGR
jgi:small redox-active disulfide protein 2